LKPTSAEVIRGKARSAEASWPAFEPWEKRGRRESESSPGSIAYLGEFAFLGSSDGVGSEQWYVSMNVIMRRAIFSLVIVWIFIIFSFSLKYAFVGDDMVLLEENQYIKNPHSLLRIFTRDYFIISKEPFFRPLPTLTYFLLYQLGGLRPALFRLFNLFFHLLCAYLIFLLMRQLLKQETVPYISALIFALHPVHIETINVITFNKDILACLFVLLAFYAYSRYKENRKFPLLLVSFFGLASALLSKESALIFILLLLFYEYWSTIQEKKKFTLRRMINIEYFTFFLITCLYVWIRFFIMIPPQMYRFYPGGSLYLNMLTMVRVVVLYIKNLFIPVSLYPEYYVSIPSSLFELDIIIWVLLILSAIIYVWILRFKLPGLLFSIGWFFIALLPVLNLMPFLPCYLGADRYLYLPMVGFSLFLGIIVNGSLHWKKKWLGYTILIGIIFFFGISGLRYNLKWKTPIKFWERTVQKYPDYSHPRLVLAEHYQRKSLWDESIAEYKKIIEIDKNLPAAHLRLGECYLEKGEYRLAMEELKIAQKSSPFDTEIKDKITYATLLLEQKTEELVSSPITLAQKYMDAGLYQEAKEICDEVLKEDPNNVEVLSILGHCYFKGELYVPAQKIYQRVLLLNPDRVDVLNNLAIIYFKSGQFEKAVGAFQALIKNSPDNPVCYLNLGVVYLAKRDYKQALKVLKKGEKISSNSADIYFNIGRAYWGLKKRELALQNFREALRINPDAYYVSQEMKKLGIEIE